MVNEEIGKSEPDYTENSVDEPRRLEVANVDDEALGPLRELPGTWANIQLEHRGKGDDGEFVGKGSLDGDGKSELDGRGWNMIALPFVRDGGGRPPYRLLMNQYNEVLQFEHVDDKVPNRGINFGAPGGPQNTDQEVAALDYTQRIRQLKAADDANSGKAFDPALPIHHEPGFFLHMKKQTINEFTIARLATIPHGNAANALGKSIDFEGPPTVPALSGMPEGATNFDVVDAAMTKFPEPDPVAYLAPYRHFINKPFKGVVKAPGFPGFEPLNANGLLQGSIAGFAGRIKHTTELVLDTDVMEAGIVNIPFIERQADAALMRSTFWIMELDEDGPDGNPRMLLAYSQFIFLDFFPRRDGRDGLIRWPHISINVMEKIAEPGD